MWTPNDFEQWLRSMGLLEIRFYPAIVGKSTTVAEAAIAIGLKAGEEGRIAKTLIWSDVQEPQIKAYIFCSGLTRADENRINAVAAKWGMQRLQPLKRKDVEAACGFLPGAVPPFPSPQHLQASQWRALFDSDLRSVSQPIFVSGAVPDGLYSVDLRELTRSWRCLIGSDKVKFF